MSLYREVKCICDGYLKSKVIKNETFLLKRDSC